MKIRRINESSNKKFYIDEIVSARGGKTKTERHFFATLDELKKYCKDSGLTKDDIANCGGCNIKDLCESYAHVKIPRAIKEFVDNLCDEINADQGDGEHDEEDEDPWSTEYGYNENLWDRGTGGDYNMYGKPSSYYADEVMDAVIEKFGDVLKTDEQKLAVYCYVEFMDDPEWVDTLSEDIEKLHTKPNGEYLDEPMYNSDDYDDDYSNDYDESLEECSGIKAHKVIMGEDLDNSFDDIDDVEGPTGDKTEDIEFVMEEYVAESLLIDFVEKVDTLTYKVGANDQIVTVVFDPKWSEYVYTIDGKGPYSHRSYEFISRDIYNFVMSQTGDSESDDVVD